MPNLAKNLGLLVCGGVTALVLIYLSSPPPGNTKSILAQGPRPGSASTAAGVEAETCDHDDSDQRTAKLEPASALDAGSWVRPSGSAILMPEEKADMVMLTTELLAATETDLGRATSLREYSINLQVRAKLLGVFERLDADSYRILTSKEEELRDARETKDHAVMVLEATPGRRVMMSFRRDVDRAVFDVIDQSAAAIQEQWNAEASAFNSLPADERSRRIHGDAESRKELIRISTAVAERRKAGNGQLPADAELSRIRALNEQLLPYYLVVRPSTDTVAPRRSIGR